MPVTALHHTDAFRQAVHCLEDPDEFGLAVSGGALTADFLSRQAEPTRIEQFQTQAWALDFQEAHVHARIVGGLPSGWAALGIMCGPAPSAWYGVNALPGMMVCTPPGESIDGCTCLGFRCVSFGLSPRLWEQCRQVAAPERAEFGSCTTQPLPAAVFARLMRDLPRIRCLLQQAALSPELVPQAMDEAAQLVFEMGVAAWEMTEQLPVWRDSLRNRARLARRAEAWLREHQTEPVSVPQVCTVLGVSRRELEYAFRSNFDISPQAYLEMLRLNAIRRHLRRSVRRHETLAEIVLEHGLTHFGRFSLSYRKLFGERPRETLRHQARQ